MARTLTGRVLAWLSCLFLLMPVSAHARQYHMHSISGSGAKAALTTKWDDGFVVLLDGTRKDGGIQIKVIGGVDTVEVRFRTNGKADDKVVYKHGELRGFGLLEELASELKVSKNPLENLQPSYIVQSLQDTLSKAAAEKQFKNEMKDVDKSDWTTTINKGVEAGQRAAETQQQIASADLSGFEKEYLLRPGSADLTAYIAINKDKCDDVLKRVLTSCAAYNALDKKQQRELLRWEAIEQSVGWYNSNCGK